MSHPDQCRCRWCGELIANPRPNQRFCSDQHRHLWHRDQRISPAQLDVRIRAIVREELAVVLSGK